MKFEGQGFPDGEFASKCLFRYIYAVFNEETQKVDKHLSPAWTLSEQYYFSLEDAKQSHGEYVKWPVEMYDNSLVYIPAPEEMK